MFTIEYVKDLQWADQEKSIITCNVKYKEFDEIHPTGVMKNDQYYHIQKIWANAIAGNYGEIKEFYEVHISESALK